MGIAAYREQHADQKKKICRDHLLVGYFLRYICVAVSVRDLLRSAVCILSHISGVEQDK